MAKPTATYEWDWSDIPTDFDMHGVMVDGQLKYFSNVKLIASSTGTPIPPAPITRKAKCIVASLYVRATPDPKGTPVGGLALNQEVDVLQTQNGWAELVKPAGWASLTGLKFL